MSLAKTLEHKEREQLNQAQSALRLAGEALRLFKPSKHQWAQHTKAIAAIKACGITV